MTPHSNSALADIAASAHHVSRQYPGVLALDDVSIEIGVGEVRALLGKNGAGKSTLIRILTGAETPNAGKVRLGGVELDGGDAIRTRRAAQLGVRAVYQELSLVPGMEVAENMFLGVWPKAGGAISHREMHERAGQILKDLGFHIDPTAMVSELSPARRQLVEIARAMMEDARLVILDEPTSSLASDEVELVFEAVRRAAARGISVLYVSHRMKEIRAIASTATVMRDGRIIDTINVDETKTEAIVAMMLGKAAEKRPVARKREVGETLLEVRDLQVAPKIESASFVARSGEVLGIAGLLGSGRTELMRAIAGIDRPDHGEVLLRGVAMEGISYVGRIARGIAITPENRKDDGVFPLLGVDENIVLGDWKQVCRNGVVQAGRVRSAVVDVIERMSIKATRPDIPVGTLSGGNQQKVVIGRWIHAGASVLLLDEPTRGVDVEAKTQIYDLVRSVTAEGAAVIFVSSEVEELPLVCDRVLVLREGRIMDEFKSPNIDAETVLAACIN